MEALSIADERISADLMVLFSPEVPDWFRSWLWLVLLDLRTIGKNVKMKERPSSLLISHTRSRPAGGICIRCGLSYRLEIYSSPGAPKQATRHRKVPRKKLNKRTTNP